MIGARLVELALQMDHERTLEQLKEALHAHHQALEQLESAPLEFEQSISSG